MLPFALPLCPVDGCPQPHTADVWKAVNPPTIRYPMPAGANLNTLDWVEDAINAHVIERAREVDRVVREHLESHDVLDFVKTIQRLQQDIGQYDSGIRPNRHRDPVQEQAIRDAATQVQALQQDGYC